MALGLCLRVLDSCTLNWKASASSLVIGIALGLSAPALAQSGTAGRQDDGRSADTSPSQPQDEEIVVTGTLLRGTAPVGSNVISLGEEAVATTGATTSNELLATVPQVTNYFNRVPVTDLAIAVNQLQISRPNIRNVSPNNAASSATLILVDGHRIATVGIKQASVDPDIIPTGAIERVEVVTEGGSATYGADAVAGVINFITRRGFDGAKVDARYGFADEYWQADASLTAGKDWGTGSAFVSYTFTKNDALFGRDRDFIRGLDYSAQPYVPLGRACDLPNVAINTTFAGFTVSSVNYAYPALLPNTVNPCDTTKQGTIVPAAERHGVMAGLFQNLDDTTSAMLRAFWSRRTTLSTSTLGGTVTMTSANPFYILPPGVAPATPPFAQAQSVSFSFAPLLGRDTQHSGTLTQEWGTNAELTKELGADWELRGLFNYSQSDSAFYLRGPNANRLNAAGRSSNPATAIDPYNIALTNRALVDDIIDNEIAGQAKDHLLQLRAIAQGKLVTLPGGDVRMALGYEFMRDEFQQRYQSEIRIGTLGSFPFSRYDRSVHSVFGEVQIPVFGGDSAVGGARSLVISASGRYDHYSDFGHTLNPKVGATWKPVDWFALRGNWGTSFTAPTPLDQLGSAQNQLSSFPFVPFLRPGDTLAGGQNFAVALQGSQPNLKPQKADTWSVGFDADPPFLPGLHMSLSYYNVVFQDILATPTPNVGIFANFPNNVVTAVAGLTAAQLRAFEPLASNGAAVIEPLIANGTRVYEFIDFRTGNFGVMKVSGLDFSASYRRQTGFGSFDLSVNGNYQLTRKSQASPGAAVIDVLLTENPKIALQSSAGITIGDFRAQATWNHTGGYAIVPTTSVPVQRRVGAFDTVDLFFKYDVPGEGFLFKDLSFTLNVRNALDQDPPVILRNNPGESGFANGFTFGRMFIFGVSKKF